jgi:hypothetical protein
MATVGLPNRRTSELDHSRLSRAPRDSAIRSRLTNPISRHAAVTTHLSAGFHSATSRERPKVTHSASEPYLITNRRILLGVPTDSKEVENAAARDIASLSQLHPHHRRAKLLGHSGSGTGFGARLRRPVDTVWNRGVQSSCARQYSARQKQAEDQAEFLARCCRPAWRPQDLAEDMAEYLADECPLFSEVVYSFRNWTTPTAHHNAMLIAITLPNRNPPSLYCWPHRWMRQ